MMLFYIWHHKPQAILCCISPANVRRKLLGIISQDPSVSNSNQLYVDSVGFLYLFDVYSIVSSKLVGNFLEVLNFNQLFCKIN